MKNIKVTTNGLSGQAWIKRLEKKGYNIGNYAKELLEHSGLKILKKSYNIVILKGEEMGKDWFTNQEVRDKAKELGYLTPPVELAPLLREMISDEELKKMGLWWLIVMHEPITDSDGRPDVLGIGRLDEGRWLNACHGGARYGWYRAGGFVFLVPQDTLPSALVSLDKHLDPLNLESRVKNLEEDMERVINWAKQIAPPEL